jgi:hypothetical protein
VFRAEAQVLNMVFKIWLELNIRIKNFCQVMAKTVKAYMEIPGDQQNIKGTLQAASHFVFQVIFEFFEESFFWLTVDYVKKLQLNMASLGLCVRPYRLRTSLSFHGDSCCASQCNLQRLTPTSGRAFS